MNFDEAVIVIATLKSPYVPHPMQPARQAGRVTPSASRRLRGFGICRGFGLSTVFLLRKGCFHQSSFFA